VSLGKIVRFDPVRGCGFIRPDDDSADVYVHSDELGGHLDVIVGTPVRFSSVQGAQWPKAYNVIILTSAFDERDRLSIPVDSRVEVQVLSDRDYMKEVTEVLFSELPNATVSQIFEIRSQLTKQAARRGWVRALS
jgi:cold shock protein